MKRGLSALAAIALTACAPHVRLATPPAEYLECADWPDATDMPAWDWTSIEIARAIARQRDLITLAYEQAGYTAHADCKADIAAVKAWADKVGD